MTLLSVREYARLTTADVLRTPDQAHISQPDFEWLCRLCEKDAAFGQLCRPDTLQLSSLVGVLASPYGLQLEIVPKTRHGKDSIAACRRNLIRMLNRVYDLNCKESGIADVSLFEMPLTEWVARQFLLRLQNLVRQGLRFDYRRVEEEEPFLRGQLDMRKQLHQLPHRLNLFHIRYDIFSPDRAENRLLRRALDMVNGNVRDTENWRLGTTLRRLMSAVPPSLHTTEDLALWSNDRLMRSYGDIRPWCELILGKYMPKAIAGDQQGISLLFPMQDLFEQYVALSLRSQLADGAELKVQAAEQHLCRRDGLPAFSLRPDLLVSFGGRQWVLDTKWKRLEKSGDIGTQDIYQLYVYGQQYLNGQGEVMLIYPEHDLFPHPQHSFSYRNSDLRLLIATFNPDTDRLYCDGEDSASLPWLKRE